MAFLTFELIHCSENVGDREKQANEMRIIYYTRDRDHDEHNLLPHASITHLVFRVLS